MNDWSRSRKRIILGIVFFVAIVIIGLPSFFIFYRTPSCADSVMNGDETGVDCGGSCQLICNAESLPLIIKGDPRVLTIATSTYEVVALLENPNTTAEIYRAQYTLRLYNPESSIPVKVIEGSTFIPRGQDFAIFEGPFTLPETVSASHATLEWHKESLVWRKNIEAEPEMRVKDKLLTKTDTSPRLEARVENLSLEDVSNLDVVALIYDENGNIFAASKTFINRLPSGESAPIIFSWPRPFQNVAIGVEVLVRIFPDSSFIK